MDCETKQAKLAAIFDADAADQHRNPRAVPRKYSVSNAGQEPVRSSVRRCRSATPFHSAGVLSRQFKKLLPRNSSREPRACPGSSHSPRVRAPRPRSRCLRLPRPPACESVRRFGAAPARVLAAGDIADRGQDAGGLAAERQRRHRDGGGVQFRLCETARLRNPALPWPGFLPAPWDTRSAENAVRPDDDDGSDREDNSPRPRPP